MGERFCGLDQTHLECKWNLVEIMIQVQILSTDSNEDQKKRSSPKIEEFLSSKFGEDQK